MEENRIKKITNIIAKPLLIIACIMFALPSILYYINNKTIYNFDQYFKFLLNDTNRIEQTIIYFFLLSIITILYVVIIKNRKKLFKNMKQIMIYVAIIALIFVAVVPFLSSDIFYYLGIGRLDSTYGQNPYYTTIKDHIEVEGNQEILKQDTVIAQGNINDWSDSTVVYGPVWTLVCKAVGFLSLGNIDWGLFVFKILNVIVHLVNCYLIYKLTNKKMFALIYGLNPFILIEAIASVHNDIYIILFVLASIYFLLKRKNILISVAFLALATAIKYFAIILLPFIIIYYFRKEKPSKRFIKCIQYGLWFIIVLAVCYLFYIRDLQVFSGLLIQQEKLAKSMYLIIPNDMLKILKRFFIGSFTIIYFWTCIILLNKKEIKFRKEIRIANYFILAFIFFIITNFQPWYIMWIFPCLFWQKAENIKWFLQISILVEFANMIFLVYGEGWQHGIPFSFILIIGSLGMKILNDKIKKERQLKCFKR